jgi:hypothetical protein
LKFNDLHDFSPFWQFPPTVNLNPTKTTKTMMV